MKKEKEVDMGCTYDYFDGSWLSEWREDPQDDKNLVRPVLKN